MGCEFLRGKQICGVCVCLRTGWNELGRTDFSDLCSFERCSCAESEV